MTVLEELRQLEPLFHLVDRGATRADIGRLLAEDFWEVGASGGRYSREFVLDVLERRLGEQRDERYETSGHDCRDLGNGHYLLTYKLLQATRISRRASLWRRSSDGWQLVYHQGTVAQD